MKKLAVFLLPLLLSGCFVNKEIVGKYKYKGIYGVGYEIDLHSNNVFSYYWQNGLNSGTITGIYKEQGDSIIVLNGGAKPPRQRIRVEERVRDSNDSTYIEVKDFENNPLAMAVVVLNSDQRIITDMDGKVVIKKINNIKEIKVFYLSAAIPEYQVLNAQSNQFLIQVYIPLKKDVYFNNVEVRRKGSKLIMTGNSVSDGKSIILEKLK